MALNNMIASKHYDLAVVLIFVISLVFLVYHNPSDQNIKQVELAGTRVGVELALTPEEYQRGLSGRAELGEGKGMLFVFDKPGRYLFWMKNMNFPIDIIWIAEDKRVVYIKQNASPEDFLETYGPDQDAQYVLEVNAGFAKENNVQVGDEVEFAY